ncbi:hypothetical protein ABIA65_002613 [Mycolicibacterium sp. 624]
MTPSPVPECPSVNQEPQLTRSRTTPPADHPDHIPPAPPARSRIAPAPGDGSTSRSPRAPSFGRGVGRGVHSHFRTPHTDRRVGINSETSDRLNRPCFTAESSVHGRPACSAPSPDAANISRQRRSPSRLVRIHLVGADEIRRHPVIRLLATHGPHPRCRPHRYVIIRERGDVGARLWVGEVLWETVEPVQLLVQVALQTPLSYYPAENEPRFPGHPHRSAPTGMASKCPSAPAAQPRSHGGGRIARLRRG